MSNMSNSWQMRCFLTYTCDHCHCMHRRLQQLHGNTRKLLSSKQEALKQAQGWKAKCNQLKEEKNALTEAHEQLGSYMSQGKADLCPHPPSMPPPEHLLGKHQTFAAKKRPFQQTLAAGKKQKRGQKGSGPRPLPIGMTPSETATMNQKVCQKGSAHKASQAKASGQSAKNNPQPNWNKPPPLNLLE